eukprot:IDg18784t1
MMAGRQTASLCSKAAFRNESTRPICPLPNGRALLQPQHVARARNACYIYVTLLRAHGCANRISLSKLNCALRALCASLHLSSPPRELRVCQSLVAISTETETGAFRFRDSH